jgi:hypothetical protein
MRNRILVALLVILGFAGVSAAQQISPPGTLPIGVNSEHNAGFLYYSLAYQTWQAKVLVGNSTTGAGATILVTAPSALSDGYIPTPAAIYGANTGMVFPKLNIVDAVAETITPTAVSVGACPAGTAGPIGSLCATITATIANTHGQGAFVLSGDQGIAEAINDAFLQGGGLVYWVADTGNVTLSTGGVTTTTTAFVPSSFYSEGCAGRVTTTITTSTSWAVGISGSTTAFCTAQTTLTAGTVANIVALNNPTAIGTTGTVTLTAILITMGTGAPGAGAVHARVWGFTAVQPSF